MNEEEYLVSLEKELKPVLKKYINSREPINHGRTVTSTQLSIENCMDDMDDIQKRDDTDRGAPEKRNRNNSN